MWIAAIIGAAINQISYLWQRKKNKDEIDRQAGKAEAAYRSEKNYNDRMFNLQKDEAQDQLGTQRNRLAEAFGADVAGFNLGLEGQALDTHAARVGLSESEGAALAAQGASGTRGSDSLQRQIDYQENMFGRQVDLQEQGNSLAIQDMARQYGYAFSDIDREMDSWNPGGYRYEAKGLSDAFAANMHGLQMGEYEHAKRELNDPLNVAMGFITAGFQGASTGAGMGMSIEKYYDAKDVNKNPWNGVGKGTT